MAEKIEKGDHVQIGFGKVHWVMENDPWQTESGSPYWVFNLRSGLSGRLRTEVCRPGDINLVAKAKDARP